MERSHRRCRTSVWSTVHRISPARFTIALLVAFASLLLFPGREQLLAQEERAAAPLATGAITGYVYQADGITPIENIHVYVEDYDTGRWYDGQETGPDGRYTLIGLPSGDYRVATCPSCTGQNYVQEYYREMHDYDQATRVTVTAPGTLSGINFTLDPAGIVTGRVTDGGGMPIEDLHIAAIRVADEAWFGGSNTDVSGYYTFTTVPATDVYIYACSGCSDHPYLNEYYDGSLTTEGATVLSIAAGVTTTDIDFVLGMGGAIAGHVYRADGVTPIAGANVHAQSYDDDRWHEGTQTEADGSYVIRRLPTGDYRVTADSLGYLGEHYRDTADWSRASRVSVSVPDTTRGIDFALEQGDATIRGHVRYGDGTPVSDIDVHASRWHMSGWTYGRTDTNAAYALTVSAGTWVVEASFWDRRAVGHTLDATPLIAIDSQETVRNVDITLLPNDATVFGTVYEQDSTTPIPDAEVALRDETTDWHIGREVYADATGYYTLPVPAGTWRINAWRDGYIQPPQQQLTIASGETQQKDLYLSALRATVSGRVLDQNDDPVPNAWVWGDHVKTSESSNTQADASGVYTLPLYAGRWYLYADRTPDYTQLSGRSVVVTDTQHLTGVDMRVNKATAVIQGAVRLGSYSGPLVSRQTDIKIDNRERSEWTHYSTIGSTGFYTSGVTAGQWDVYAHLEGYTCKESRQIGIADGQTLTADVVLLPNTALINGKVIDQYGFPVPNADVSVQDSDSGRQMVPWHLGDADSIGQYTVDVAEGRWRICVWRDGYNDLGCPDIGIAAGETRQLDFVMQSRISAISSLVTDLRPNPGDNVPLEGANVMLWDQYGIAPVSDASGPIVADTTDSQGRSEFSLQVENGPYLVRAFHNGYTHGQGLIYAQGGRHPAGTIRLPEQAGGTLSGQVTAGGAPVAGAVVVVRRANSMASATTQDGLFARTTTGADGNYDLKVSFAPGDYDVLASAVGYDHVPVAVTIAAASRTVADLALASTAPPSDVAYLTINAAETIEQDRWYPTLVQVRNVGTKTWNGSGSDKIEFYHQWRDLSGAVVQDGYPVELPYDVPPGEVIFFPVPVTSPGAGKYTLEWGLWQREHWFGETHTFSVTATEPILANLSICESCVATDPATVREGNAFSLLVSVRNDTDADAEDVAVEIFVDGAPFAAGQYRLSSVPRRSTVLLRVAAYAPLSRGWHSFLIRVDADDRNNETNEDDNLIRKMLNVLPYASDTKAPTGKITINNNALTTDLPAVNLALSATDNPGGTGVQYMFVTEFVFDATVGQWQIARESDWIDYATTLDWTLSPGGGAKHFQARFADGEWNISDAALAWINHTPACDEVGLAEWKLYQWPLEKGESIAVTARPCGGRGDPDLYAWIGPSGGSPHYYSSNAGAAPDVIALTAPETNRYGFWVYGFESTTYNVTMNLGDAVMSAGQGGKARVGSLSKELPEAPPSVIESPTYVPSTPLMQRWFPFVFHTTGLKPWP